LKEQTKAIPPRKDEDAEIIARCLAELPGKTDAYYELLQKYEGMVYSTCYRMLGSRQEAEEACQDTFLRIFHKLYQFEGRSTFKTWMFRIACNFCMTRRRKLATKRERDTQIGAEIVEDAEEIKRSALPGNHDHTEFVHDALHQMNDEERNIITLRFISDLSLEEMAEVLDLKLSATKMRLYRAMEKFKTIYKSQDEKRREAEDGK